MKKTNKPIKEELCGCEADEWGIEHTGQAHFPEEAWIEPLEKLLKGFEEGKVIRLQIKSFIREEIEKARKEEKDKILGNVKLMGYVDYQQNVQMLDEAHIKEIVKMVLKDLMEKD